MPPFLLIPLEVTAVAVCGAALGVFAGGLHSLSRRAVPFSGGLLLGIAGLFIVPEMAHVFGWALALAAAAAGFGLLWFVNRYVHDVCPSCSHSHSHDHGHCTTALHGFAGPLLTAATLHSLFDGWTLSASEAAPALGPAFLIGIAVHKLPEGIALGVIVRAAMRSRTQALVAASAAELATLAGAALEVGLSSYLGQQWLYALLAFAAGTFVYLGYHAIDAEYKRKGAFPALVPAATGVVGSSVIRLLGGTHPLF